MGKNHCAIMSRGLLFAAALIVSVNRWCCVASSSLPPSSSYCSTSEQDEHPVLCHHLDWLQRDPEDLAAKLHAWAEDQGWLVDPRARPSSTTLTTTRQLLRTASNKNNSQNVRNDEDPTPCAGQLPVVLAHGMGDSCFNSGFQHLVQHVSDLLGGVYTVCIPTADSQSKDTSNGFFLNMDASLDVFAATIQADPRLAQGFHAIGLSQGNNLIRGYIAKYNDPVVHSFVSINGVNAGTGALPNCFPSVVKSQAEHSSSLSASFCEILLEQASKRAYTTFSQQHLFQSNYWRDPRASMRKPYRTYSQLAAWNNEVVQDGSMNQTLIENYAKTSSFVWIMATEDTMVWPKEGEHWGAADPQDPYHASILPRNETEWFVQDLFGLKTAEEAGKNHYETFVGDHLQFSMDDFDRWVTTYLMTTTSD